MRTKKQIRHTYTKYLVIYLNMVDALKFEAADLGMFDLADVLLKVEEVASK